MNDELTIHLRVQSDLVGPIWAALLLLISGAGVLPILGWSVPLWAQPSIVGLFWGSQFIIGLWLGGAARLSAAVLIAVGLCACLLTLSFQSITDFNFAESLLFSAVIQASGWLAIRMHRLTAQPHWISVRNQPVGQLPLFDLFLATTLVACWLNAITDRAAHPILIAGVSGTLLVSICFTWAAYHWAWDDRRPVRWSILVGPMLALVGIGIVAWISPWMSTIELLEWFLRGPASVIATQVFTVLLALGLVRVRSVESRADGSAAADIVLSTEG